ncbi:hypothetical protein QMK17_09240 [Rhodococcus sp. G-MC3]|uniref:hypothetical protein n=1 Tax=Rhodococcus sp. G-MC3 TaxID=3046209 RepID=UPI0024BA5F6A|nr:hypothetical protein [Rhodococcus sp. G-MC3]MDJ0393515.1 hypothetical protein [Rhodococcus sp. G-MC3]
MAKSATPNKISTRVENPAVTCTARRTDGQPCGNYAVKGSTVCKNHGGFAPHTRLAASQRMVEMRLKAIGVVDGMLDDQALEPAIRLRAAQIVLDRTGMGPTSKVEHELEVKPYEQLLVVRDLAVPDEPEPQYEIIDAEVVPTAPDGRPGFDPSHVWKPEQTEQPAEHHNVVAFPTRPGPRA